MFSCVLCQEEYSILKNHCVVCEKIKRIINVYSKDKVLDILDKVCLRKSEKLQEYKIKNIKNEIEKPKQEHGDESYIVAPVNNPNEGILEELKQKLKSK